MSKSNEFEKFLTKKQIQSVRSTLKIPMAYPINELNSMVESSNKFGFMRITEFQ